MPLKYLFTATYEDGSQLRQLPDDVSTRDPKRSAYYDIDHDKLVSFALVGHEPATHYLVDLRDGHFEVNGVPFRMHEEPNLTVFRLIFFRQHTHHMRVGPAANEELAHQIVYRMGWQCTVDGKNYQQIMQID